MGRALLFLTFFFLDRTLDILEFAPRDSSAVKQFVLQAAAIKGLFERVADRTTPDGLTAEVILIHDKNASWIARYLLCHRGPGQAAGLRVRESISNPGGLEAGVSVEI